MNQGFPDKVRIEAYRARYLKGTRVALVQMDDPYTRLRPGDKGTVQFIDDAGGIHVAWDNGSTLAALIGVDVITVLKEETL